ncbi:MAG TPA: hypothetical protein VFV54_11130 [Thermoanaerobaculia bacterium]|nr:hypothetical protein [Thermoanaerobaculia bacterium]
MRTVRIGKLLAMTMALAALSLSGCNEGPMRTASPVELVATIDQELHVLDFADADCGEVGTVTLRNLIKRTDTETDVRFLDVVVSSYRVSYRRTDGGTQVPAPFVRTLSMLIPAGGNGTDLGSFLLFEPGAVNQAPFAALRPSNGGVDPETGKRNVTMEVIFDFFGKTLSGDDVSARARMELTFCQGCGGCV